MAVLVRKLAKRRNADVFRRSDNVEDISADAVIQEFKTSGDTLSVWETTKDDIDLGVLAIALSSGRIETMDFILLNREAVEAAGLSVKPTHPDTNPLLQANPIHRDIFDLRLRDLSRLAIVYRDAAIVDANVIRYTATDLMNKIENALMNGWIDSSKANDKIKEALDSLIDNLQNPRV